MNRSQVSAGNGGKKMPPDGVYSGGAVSVDKLARAMEEVKRIIVGQQEMLKSIFTGLLMGGHILVEGVPGLAKTLAVSSVARATSLDFQRIQFTPDLLPSDIIGTMIFNTASQVFSVKKGPVFTQILLADEINRAPPKVQSALLEAMSEKQVTIGETSFHLEEPFLVLATQNPIEQEGTYHLPEAQLDRFLFKVTVDYCDRSEEMEILNRMSSLKTPEARPVLTAEDLFAYQQQAAQVYLDDKLKNYIVDLVMATRQPKDYGLMDLVNWISVGASPRATVNFPRAARAYAFIHGKKYVTADDIKAIAYPLLRHRLILSYEAEAEEITTDDIITRIIKKVRVS